MSNFLNDDGCISNPTHFIKKRRTAAAFGIWFYDDRQYIQSEIGQNREWGSWEKVPKLSTNIRFSCSMKITVTFSVVFFKRHPQKIIKSFPYLKSDRQIVLQRIVQHESEFLIDQSRS
jgi:hypothetical protein